MADFVQLVGTTTGAREFIIRLVERHAPEDGGYLELDGVVQCEPDNPVDPHDVIVLGEGKRIGYLLGYVTKGLDVATSGARPVRVQIFTQLLENDHCAEATTWMGTDRNRASASTCVAHKWAPHPGLAATSAPRYMASS